MAETPNRFEVELKNQRDAGVTSDGDSRLSQEELKTSFWNAVFAGRSHLDKDRSADDLHDEWLANFPTALKANFLAARRNRGRSEAAPPAGDFSFRVSEVRYSSLSFALLIEGARKLYDFCNNDPALVQSLLNLCIPLATADAVGAPSDAFAVSVNAGTTTRTPLARRAGEQAGAAAELVRRMVWVPLLLPILLMILIGFLFFDYLKSAQPEREMWAHLKDRETLASERTRAAAKEWQSLTSQQRALINILMPAQSDRKDGPPPPPPPPRHALARRAADTVTASVSNIASNGTSADPALRTVP
jgi:hypothetical protein